jgi:hypothetical protein
VVLLLKRVLVTWSLAIDERDGHKDICGLGCRNIIPYVHERMELYYLSLTCLSLFLTSLSIDPFSGQCLHTCEVTLA